MGYRKIIDSIEEKNIADPPYGRSRANVYINSGFRLPYTQTHRRRIRGMMVFAEIVPFFQPIDRYGRKTRGIIPSGGPSSLYEKGHQAISDEFFSLGKCTVLGNLLRTGRALWKPITERSKGAHHAIRPRVVVKKGFSPLFRGLKKKEKVWMSPGDKVVAPPRGFRVIASSENAEIAAIACEEKKIYGVQFHPEVHHSVNGSKLLRNFLFRICCVKATWTMENFIESSVASIRKEVGEGTVLLGLSGGVDSSVTAVLLQKAIGERLYCVFVNNGVLRKDEAKQVVDKFRKHMKLNLIYVDASKRFLTKLKGVDDPEKKRQIIGAEFIKVFMDEAKKIGRFDFLAQGTLIPMSSSPFQPKGPLRP
jgi:GMP synthase (glutamine-hydrolysing)